jgi:hypothetical protein
VLWGKIQNAGQVSASCSGRITLLIINIAKTRFALPQTTYLYLVANRTHWLRLSKRHTTHSGPTRKAHLMTNPSWQTSSILRPRPVSEISSLVPRVRL